MAVTYSIHSGTPGEILVEHTASSVDAAKTTYRLWVIQASRIGNTYENSFMDVVDSRGNEHRYVPGSCIGSLRRV